ncbi:MAG: hypothetical protein ACTSRC_20325 [Candidatus Helarchaeota archaeon]
MSFLSPYSPNLNPIKRVWKFMRKKVIYNTFFNTFIKFEVLKRFFNRFKSPVPELIPLYRIS